MGKIVKLAEAISEILMIKYNPGIFVFKQIKTLKVKGGAGAKHSDIKFDELLLDLPPECFSPTELLVFWYFLRRSFTKSRKRAMILEALALNYKECQQQQIEKWIDLTRY